MRQHSLEKFQRNELSKDEALLGTRLLEGTELELLPAGSLLEAATRIAIELDHPAYDCLYLALAVTKDCRFVTADERFLRRLGQHPQSAWHDRAISLRHGAKEK